MPLLCNIYYCVLRAAADNFSWLRTHGHSQVSIGLHSRWRKIEAEVVGCQQCLLPLLAALWLFGWSCGVDELPIRSQPAILVTIFLTTRPGKVRISRLSLAHPNSEDSSMKIRGQRISRLPSSCASPDGPLRMPPQAASLPPGVGWREVVNHKSTF